MDTYRQLQRICERQAALTATPRAKQELRDMAEEYRRMAEWTERQPPEPKE